MRYFCNMIFCFIWDETTVSLSAYLFSTTKYPRFVQWVQCIHSLSKSSPWNIQYFLCYEPGCVCATYICIPFVGVSENSGAPKSSILIGGFHYKPSILGYPYFWKHPYMNIPCHNIWAINSLHCKLTIQFVFSMMSCSCTSEYTGVGPCGLPPFPMDEAQKSST